MLQELLFEDIVLEMRTSSYVKLKAIWFEIGVDRAFCCWFFTIVKGRY
jgi:hypothetical protein